MCAKKKGGGTDRQRDTVALYSRFTSFNFFQSSNSDILNIYNFYYVLLCEECHIILSYLEPILQYGVLNWHFHKVPKLMSRLCFVCTVVS